jgi:ubiquinone/menaquinone biosynthesis C-methylase UbiE
MDPKLQRRVQRYGWDRAASLYEQYWQAQLRPAQDLLLEMAALKPGDHVIEVASGTGLVTLRAAKAVGSSGSVLATDISQVMIDRLQTDARRLGLTNVPARRMDAEALDVPPASFDAALCALGLMYVPDPVVALGQMRQALKPGGRAVCAVWGSRKNCGWADIFPIVESRVRSDVCPMFFQLGTGHTLADCFTRAGFADVRSERLSTELLYHSGDAAADAAFAGGPVAMAYSRFDEETRQGARADYVASIAQFREGDRYRIPGEFVIARGSVSR